MAVNNSNDKELRRRLQSLRTGLFAYISDKFHSGHMNENTEKVLAHVIDCMSKQTCMDCTDPAKNCLLYPCLELNDFDATITWFSNNH